MEFSSHSTTYYILESEVLPFNNYHSCCSGASLNTWRFCLFFGSLSTHPPLEHWSCRCNWACVKANELGHDKWAWTFCISWLFEKAQNRLFLHGVANQFLVLSERGGGTGMYVPIWKEIVLKLQLLERNYHTVYKYPNTYSKCVMENRICAHFMVLFLDLTLMAIRIGHFTCGSFLKSGYNIFWKLGLNNEISFTTVLLS